MKKMFIAVLLLGAIAALSACSSGNAADTAGTAQQTVDNAQTDPGNNAKVIPDLIGKVVSVGNGKIVVYPSTTNPSDMPQRNPAGQGGAQGGGAQPSGQPNSGQGGGRGGMRNMQFSDQTSEYAYNAQTEVSARSFGQQGGETAAMKITDLKEGDIVSIKLLDDKSVAVSVQVMPSRSGQAGSSASGS